METIVKSIDVKGVLTKSNLPVADYSVNPYVGCAHGCKYCYASFMKRFTNHPEPWGSFVDVKCWPDIKNPKRYAGKELFLCYVTDPYQPLEETACRTRARAASAAESWRRRASYSLRVPVYAACSSSCHRCSSYPGRSFWAMA